MASLRVVIRPRAPSLSLHRRASTSGAPFTITRYPAPGLLCTVVMSFRSESKGISPFLGHSSPNLFLSSPARAAASTRAASVGSPIHTGLFPFQFSSASPHRAPMVRARSRSPWEGVQMSTTVILFWVKVPVLSEQITPAHPKVSTAGSFFTMARRLAMRLTPRASTMEMMAGRPSGMAATARDTAVRNISSRFRPWSSPTPNMTAHTHRHRKDSVLEISPIFFCKGVSLSSLSIRRPAI